MITSSFIIIAALLKLKQLRVEQVGRAQSLTDIPGVMVQGRPSPHGSLPKRGRTANSWSSTALVISSSDPGMSEAVIVAADHFAARDKVLISPRLLSAAITAVPAPTCCR
ncbi:MAG TPA: hypothetical protein VIT91_08665 [Chthoniobacterales bacterium]